MAQKQVSRFPLNEKFSGRSGHVQTMKIGTGNWGSAPIFHYMKC